MGSVPEISREPCPDRIIDDIGASFGIGAVGGGAFHLLRGMYNSPKGERLIGGCEAVRMSAPRVGGSFAVWGALFSTFDCTAVYLRQKEDPWNAIIAGAATGGFLQMRRGLAAASRSALFAAALLALIEGAGIMFNKVLTPPMEDPLQMNPHSSSSSWFGGNEEL
ncbi:mitochondrial import inner membrane translocase subunit TIM17-2-like [Salvia miltiorrhiza]|uniref:mitochondrial import inner membrane translocase subunit TIM17-2-like n=1 Tax=Salvia miltiorrhiza TaxID=226208 RepID=UPI0025ACE7E1|nr:mitochondrial import inner membrane translocase subunit TIM17-2-like [Salvia miltiorrhiza]